MVLVSLGASSLRSVELELYSSSMILYKTADDFAEEMFPISSANGLIRVSVAYEDETWSVY